MLDFLNIFRVFGKFLAFGFHPLHHSVSDSVSVRSLSHSHSLLMDSGMSVYVVVASFEIEKGFWVVNASS